MKKYILIGSAAGIGGWQLYNSARLSYLSKNSDADLYMIYIYNANSPVQLSGFNNAKLIDCPEVFRPTYVYSKNKINKTISLILESIAYSVGDDIFIEATNITTSLWGELLSQKTHGMCFSYILQSHIGNITNPIKAFLKFKYDHNLLAGMSNITIPDIFKGYFDPRDDVRELLASWESPICEQRDIPEELDQIIKKECPVIIGYFGNLSKPHFLKLCSFLKDYCNEYPNLSFLFISIGSSLNNRSEKIQAELSDIVPNLTCFNIKSLYPVPKSYFSIMDVCIGSWGSATIAAIAGALTIRLVDDVDIIPHGILGFSIVNKPYVNEPKCKESLKQLLDDILIFKKYQGIEFEIEPYFLDNMAQQMVIDNTIMAFRRDSEERKYYNVLSIKCYGLKNYTIKTFNSVLGVRNANKLMNKINNVHKKARIKWINRRGL